MDPIMNQNVSSKSSSMCIDKFVLTEREILEKIVKHYPEGIDSIISTPKPAHNNPYMMLVLRGTSNFVQKYITKAKRKDYSQPGDVTLVKINNSESTNEIDNEKNAKNIPEDSFKFLDSLKKKIMENEKNIRILKEVFNELNKTEENLVDKILREYNNEKSKKLRESDPEYYNRCLKAIQDVINRGCKMYYEFSFEDFLLLFCSIVRYYTKIEIRLELRSKNSKKVMLILYCNSEANFENLAEFFGYELQLKPYALLFQNEQDHFSNASTYIGSRKNSVASGDTKIAKIRSKLTPIDPYLYSIQFHLLDENNCLHFPPHKPYENEKKIKFRRYISNDEYHQCEHDEEFNLNFMQGNQCKEQCSKFRNIDKLRLIHKSLMHILQFSSLYKYKMISMIIYKKNYRAYGDKIEAKTLFWDIAKVYSFQTYLKTLTTIRNFYGEHISYYFLWVSSFSKWMIIPTIIGFLIHISVSQISKETLEKEFWLLGYFKIEIYDLGLIIFSLIINIWATMFLKNWKNIENMYRYYWGMEKYSVTQGQSEFYIPDQVTPFILGEVVNNSSTFKTIIKNITSFCVCSLLIIFRGLIVFLICSIIKVTKEDKTPLILLSVGSGIITKIFGVVNQYFAYQISIWENNETTVQQQNSYAIKIIFLEAANNYFYLLYIAFYKPCQSVYPCYAEKCNLELEIAIYVLLLCHFVFTLWGLVWPFIKRFIRKTIGQYNKRDIHFGRFMPHSIEHQLLCDGKNNLIHEYNQKMILFGFVCLFCNSAPLAPLIVFFINILEYFADIYKIFNLYRIEIIEGSSGIGIYNTIFKTIYFFGIFININLVLFTSQKFFTFSLSEKDIQILTNDDAFLNSTIFLVITENFMLFLIQTLRPKNVPIWFQHLGELKDLYEKKYYSRDTASLPHFSVEENEII